MSVVHPCLSTALLSYRLPDEVETYINCTSVKLSKFPPIADIDCPASEKVVPPSTSILFITIFVFFFFNYL